MKHKIRMIPRVYCLLALLLGLCCVAAITQIDLTTQVKGVLPVANGGTNTSNAATGTAGGVVLSNSPTITTPTLTSPSITGAVGSDIDLGPQRLLIEIANAGTTGTTVNKLAKLTGAPSTVVITATTDTGGAIGVVAAGAGTTSNAQIAVEGTIGCVFDNATVAGDYAQISSTTAGDCHDFGSTYPTLGQVVGRVLATGSAGTVNITVFSDEIKGATTSTINFADNEVPTGTINGSNVTFTLAHTPVSTVALSLYKNGQLQVAGAGADFTLSGATITYNAAPLTGTDLHANYRF